MQRQETNDVWPDPIAVHMAGGEKRQFGYIFGLTDFDEERDKTGAIGKELFAPVSIGLAS